MNDRSNTSLNIGVLGLGSKSTIFYIKLLNKRYNNLRGGYATCPFTLLNTDFDTINPYLPDQHVILETKLLPYLKHIESLSIKYLIVPNITLHEVLDHLMKKHAFKFTISHPVFLTIEQLKNDKKEQAVIFATHYTMNALYLKNHFSSQHIELRLPNKEDMIFIDDVRKQVYANKINISELERFNTLVHTYTSNDTPVILACTELSLAYKGTNQNVYDMVRLQINATIKTYNNV